MTLSKKEVDFVSAVADSVGLPKALTSLEIKWDIDSPLRIKAEFYVRDSDGNIVSPDIEAVELLSDLTWLEVNEE